MRKYNKTISLLSIFTLLLSSCDKQGDYKLYLVFDNVDGLTTQSEVTSNGLKIGSIENMKLFKNKVLVTTTIDKGVQIPKGSTFLLESVDLFRGKVISVSLESTTTTYYADKDTIYGQLSKNLLADSTTVKHLKPLVDTLANAIQDFGKNISNDKRK